MLKNPDFEIVNISNEYMAIPLGEEVSSFHGVVSLSEATAYLLGKMTHPVSRDDLIELLLDEYDIDRDVAEKDIDLILNKLIELKVVLV